MVASLRRQAEGLLTRLARVRPFLLNTPMVGAAALSDAAQLAVELHMRRLREGLGERIHAYLAWLSGPAGRGVSPPVAQRMFVQLKLLFDALLHQLDIFADVVSQRGEHDTGVWLAGLDALASEALAVPGVPQPATPLICYLDRGMGAAIRRAGTPLPGGASNPVAVIRIPRERMLGSSLASSLVHEVGHQGAVTLGLLDSLGAVFQARKEEQGGSWGWWRLWLLEIIPDFWAVSRLGVTATQGLMEVVNLPRALVFRITPGDPHPFPWMRVKMSCALGERLYPDPQWRRLAALWESCYPRQGVAADTLAVIDQLEAGLPEMIETLLSHRPPSLGGRSLEQAFRAPDREPARLRALLPELQRSGGRLTHGSGTLFFAVTGQALADDRLTPEREAAWLSGLLTRLAMKRALLERRACAVPVARTAMH